MCVSVRPNSMKSEKARGQHMGKPLFIDGFSKRLANFHKSVSQHWCSVTYFIGTGRIENEAETVQNKAEKKGKWYAIGFFPVLLFPILFWQFFPSMFSCKKKLEDIRRDSSLCGNYARARKRKKVFIHFHDLNSVLCAFLQENPADGLDRLI
jgi:hypothetical protein